MSMGKYSIEFYDPEPQYGGWFLLKVVDAKTKNVASQKAEKLFHGNTKLRITKVKDAEKTENELCERDVRHAMKGNY